MYRVTLVENMQHYRETGKGAIAIFVDTDDEIDDAVCFSKCYGLDFIVERIEDVGR